MRKAMTLIDLSREKEKRENRTAEDEKEGRGGGNTEMQGR